MPKTFPSVSLILRTDQPAIDQQIRESVLTLGKCRWRAEVLLIDPDTEDETEIAQKVCCRPVPKSFATLGQAIQAAKHPLVAIADPGFAINSNDWQFVSERAQTRPIQTFFYENKQPNSFKRFLICVYSLFVRALFGIRKHEFTQGITLIERDGIPDEIRNPNPDTTSVWELLTAYRLKVQKSSEMKTDPSIENQTFPLGRIRSKTIYRSFGIATHYWWNQIMFPQTQLALPKKRYKSKQKIATTLVLLGLACMVFLTALNFPLFEPDEARNAQLALNVLETGDWMSLKLANESYWDKPPLQIWAIAASYSVFGPSPFATRLPIGLASVLTVMLTFLLGKIVVGFRPAVMGAVLLMLSCGFVLCGRYVTMDATLTATVTAMLLCGYISIRDGFRRKFALLAGVACGIGILAKGPVIGVLAVPPLVAAAFLSQTTFTSKRSPKLIGRLIWFAAPAVLIAAPWFIATAIIHPDFLGYFFWKHHVVRFSNAFNHREPFWYYLIGIFLFMFPASYLLPSMVKFMTSRKPENRLVRTREQGFLFLSAIWIIGFFTIAESKLPTYILPAFPLICLLMGVLVERKILTKPAEGIASKRTFLERLQTKAPQALAFWTVIACVSLIALFELQTVTAIAIVLTIAVTVGLVALSIRKSNRPKIVWSCFAVIGLLLMSVIAHQIIPSVSAERSIHVAAQKIQSEPAYADAPIVFFGRESYGAGLCLDNVKQFRFNQTASVVEFLRANPSAILIASKDTMKTLRSDLPWTIKLEQCEDARHLYLSRPHQTVIAREQASRLYR
ncbi:MAG: ArnT family glycosyltransferase [Mariniblastus sp.]